MPRHVAPLPPDPSEERDSLHARHGTRRRRSGGRQQQVEVVYREDNRVLVQDDGRLVDPSDAPAEIHEHLRCLFDSGDLLDEDGQIPREVSWEASFLQLCEDSQSTPRLRSFILDLISKAGVFIADVSNPLSTTNNLSDLVNLRQDYITFKVIELLSAIKADNAGDVGSVAYIEEFINKVRAENDEEEHKAAFRFFEGLFNDEDDLVD